MKMKSGVEQAICILAMLATQVNQDPIKSFVLSERLKVSDSFLKKIVRRLVVAGLVESSASKEGGFSLAKSPSEITMLDIFEAIEGKQSAIQPLHLAEHVFFANDSVITKENEVLNIFYEAERLFKDKLNQFSLTDVLTSHDYEKKMFDWKNIMSELGQ
ncbi:RrF2 family transcriptional regulator [Sporolactobacillus kofuensis]|uniref:RrF2 family transcriptional regulator n=1 Tax=Sporolactobacillus kofuensis TaxID=269672 RepID=A0ABW1WGU8_9BACL|nr:Rrf2 family transcriptional regulator [Sporolactobacillus kofuensis]MCO7175858.1 Rrf2 family transcriptional regulator [Sporolactobacillus kofuensis]